ncbi:Cell wall binding repeat-containing protein [Bacillus mycoides]|uniref:hypothetical protein n=1 Tax=Bacillus mycoides TaxID=1405 RepID=UPI0001A04DBE|nr:hypothetical protein [Bacillus mycoides]AIW87911.1 Cell wall binding repeat-containing protein [Bacillus mycoides]EEL03189.1 cell wall binding repeat-containing protein [Bacillus cereus BDRD-ST196]GAE42756.1 hypothetical protein BW1_072_00630 [Bacillus mycoides NBRC 101238 = DSM 11821]
MQKLFKITGKKVIPVAAALGILVSAAPIAENKAQAASARSIARLIEVSITGLGIVRDIHGVLETSTGYEDLSGYDGRYAENVSYKSPSFQTGEFNISMYHTQNDLNFLKSVKLLRPNGQIETHQLRSGQQLKITEAGTIVDLNPNAESLSERDLLYITQAQLDEGKTGVALNQVKTIYVEKTSGQNVLLVEEFYKQRFGQNSLDGFKGLGTDLFSYLTAEQKQLATLTSRPVYKETLSNYVMNNTEARTDFNNRAVQIVTAGATHTLDATINMGYSSRTENWKITPYEAGTNKVLVKTDNGYFTGICMLDTSTQYSESINNAKVFRLVQHTGPSNSIYFRLTDDNGDVFTRSSSNNKFIDRSYRNITDAGNVRQPVRNSHIKITNKTNIEINNWLSNSQTQPTNGGNLPEGPRIRGPFDR